MNENIVSEYKGVIKGLGELRTIFDFNAKTETSVIDKTAGVARKFSSPESDKDAILNAYKWINQRSIKVSDPFPSCIRKISKRN